MTALGATLMHRGEQDGNLKRQNFQLAEETLVEVIFSSPGLLMIFNIFSRAGSS